MKGALRTIGWATLRITAYVAPIAGLLALGIWWLGNPPDLPVSWSREVRAEATSQELRTELWKAEHWPRWFFYLERVERVNEAGDVLPFQLVPGALLRLSMDPKKGFSRKSELRARVLEFDPGQGLTLRLEFDSSGKLTGLFDVLTWKLALVTDTSGRITLRGSETARTRARRSRVYCRLAPQVLLNQIYPVDLLGLARMTKVSEPPPVRLGF